MDYISNNTEEEILKLLPWYNLKDESVVMNETFAVLRKCKESLKEGIELELDEENQ